MVPLQSVMSGVSTPARWQAVEDLLGHEDGASTDDLRKRLVDGVDGAQDAFAVVPDGSHVLASACVRRRHDVGVMGHLFTRPAQRRHGHARTLMQALLSWFDMTGGKWLYVTSPSDLVEGLFETFGFKALQPSGQESPERVTMLRRLTHVSESPFEGLTGRAAIRDVGRADWALLVALLQHHAGPDPRVGLDESALTAETTALELLTQQERGACRLKATCCHGRIIGLGSVATGQEGQRTYAMLMPHDCPPQGLREAVLEFARAQGFVQVDFPMEALGEAPATAPNP